MAVTALPTPPSRSDPATFAERGDAFMSALPTFQAEINALQITTNAQTAADAAASATSAAEAVVAKNAAIAAWAASMSPAETLPALSQSLHIGAVVKAIVYDTSKDSDGGAWRKRCADKSWYTETLGGDRWIGQHATISAAWTAAGSTTGAVYQASATAGAQTSDLYYTPTSSTTVTQVYRGITREFPAVAGIVAESARVVIYDLATGAMWMVFVSASGTFLRGTPTAGVAMVNGSLVTATSDSGYKAINFLSETFYWRSSGGTFSYPLTTVASRNSVQTFYSPSGTVIINSNVNDVAITVLDSAPIDSATGLPVPTIAVATAGGLSVINNDGTVANDPATYSVRFVTCDGKRVLWKDNQDTGYLTANLPLLTSATRFSSSAVPLSGFWGAQLVPCQGGVLASGFEVRGLYGLSLLKENPATPTAGMVAYITTAYNSGWLPGDIRGAYLADTTAETVTASGELVLTPDFAADANWTKGTGWAIGSGVATKTAGTAANLSQVINTVVGRTYTFTFDATRSAGTLTVQAVGATVATITASATTSVNFTATATTTTISFNADSTFAGTVDNSSVKLAEPDRSVKNKGLVINGSLTKTAVASGAGLVAWSGFSGSNYLEQPYNSDLDFGTGDFCVMGWVNTGPLTTAITLFRRGITASLGGILVEINAAGTVSVYGSSSTTYTNILTTTATVSASTLAFISVSRASGTVSVGINGVVVSTASNSTDLTYANAVSQIGSRTGAGANYGHSLALWRISATAPSADQIAHIYRTELPLFQASAQCTIAGSSTAVTALAYDDTTELLHVGTSWGRTGFKDLLRVDSEATTTGALTSLSASQGVIITGGTSGKVYVPAMLLRDELRRKDEARKALGKVPVFFDHTATASQTAFVAPKGYTIKAVYHNGTLKRETTTGVYWTRSTDGFAETCTLSAGATVSDWISLMCVRT